MSGMTITKRKWNRIICMEVFVISLLILAGKGGKINENIHEETASQEEQNIEEEVEKTESIAEDIEEADTEYGDYVSFSDYDCLNNDRLIEPEILNYTTRELREMGMCLYSEELKGEFIPVIPEDCSFPEELIIAMEDIFYNSANSYERDTRRIVMQMKNSGNWVRKSLKYSRRMSVIG